MLTDEQNSAQSLKSESASISAADARSCAAALILSTGELSGQPSRPDVVLGRLKVAVALEDIDQRLASSPHDGRSVLPERQEILRRAHTQRVPPLKSFPTKPSKPAFRAACLTMSRTDVVPSGRASQSSMSARVHVEVKAIRPSPKGSALLWRMKTRQVPSARQARSRFEGPRVRHRDCLLDILGQCLQVVHRHLVLADQTRFLNQSPRGRGIVAPAWCGSSAFTAGSFSNS